MAPRKKTLERRKEIVQAAVHIIDTEGIHALTLQSIAGQLGVSDVALLRHFRSKEEIVETLAQKVFFSTVVPEMFDPNAPLVDNLESLLDHQFAEFEAWPESTSVLFGEEILREYPAVREWFLVRRKERHNKLVHMVNTGKAAGVIWQDLDADAFATAFMGAMRMAVMDWRDGGRTSSLRSQALPLAVLLAKAAEA